MPNDTQICTIGYGGWPTKNRLQKLLTTLADARVNTLIDIRHSPCPAILDPRSNYGPRPWHLLAGGEGLDGHLRRVGIDYEWVGELGNPQKNDPEMSILLSHLAQANAAWPVNRGLARLYDVLRSSRRCALLCACPQYDECHRKTIVESLNQRYFAGGLSMVELTR